MGSRAKPAVPRGLNLNASRLQRAKAHAARRGVAPGDPVTLPIIFGAGDAVIAEIGPELPLDVLAPLLGVNVDLPSLVVQLMEASAKLGEGEADRAEATLEALVGVLVTNPNLPADLVEAVKEIGRTLLTDAGYEAFVAERPSGQDVTALVSGLLEWYGVSLGELLGSSPSAIDGETSKPISLPDTPERTSPGSGGSPETLDSSASAA